MTHFWTFYETINIEQCYSIMIRGWKKEGGTAQRQEKSYLF
jgi:hypothetical protein